MIGLGLEIPVFLGAAAAGFAEYAGHKKRLSSIPVRVCVNGTRGKSSVVRLIAAALRDSGIPCLAKTTGTAPRIILPDGREEVFRRRGPARIIEQTRVARMAFRLGAKALVVECMALAPENQGVFETMLTASTIGVITNVRLDHRDVMGGTEGEVEEALANTVPHNATLVVGETQGGSIITAQCKKRGTRLFHALPGEEDSAAAARFPYTAFPENIAVALKVCELCGIGREKALAAMLKAIPDPGVRPLVSFGRGGRNFRILDAFAANDYESTLGVWERFGPRGREGKYLVMAVNNREDRPWRSLEMSAVADKISSDLVVLLRQGRAFRGRILAGAPSKGGPLWAENLDDLLGLAESKAGQSKEVWIFLCGNVKGAGFALQREIDAKAREER
ncbi:MAG: Mur ligase middle domain-containing protein [Spirochaetes bacterium]|nr:MAG: Mur ligase middle domain-containing protein [Spirochaetota bacterium]